MPEDLWPAEFGTLDVVPPISILKEQAELITAKSKGNIVGRVWTSKYEKGFAHELNLIAPLLDSYAYRLLVAAHTIDLYPVEISAEVVHRRFTCKSPEEFSLALKEIFGSDNTKRVVAAILAQTDALVAPGAK